jgi:ligand-binding sensor domain-containing protein/serine phosphatase RsbU (regulator of sigma subunit)
MNFRIFHLDKKHYVFLLLQFFLQLHSYSQEYKFSHITAEQGLSMNTVKCILQDSRGFMWFGTEDGLNRYDGYKITVFKHNPLDSNSLSNNFINALYQDKRNTLWIGTEGGGLNSYNLSTGKIVAYKFNEISNNSLSNNIVRVIMEDTSGMLWIGTENGLNTFDSKTKKIKRYSLNEGLSNALITSIFQSSDGTIWIGTYGGGLNSFNKKSNNFKSYLPPAKNKESAELSKKIRAIYEYKKNELWVGTYGEGIFVFDLEAKKFTKQYIATKETKNTISNNKVLSISKTADNKLWIGTYGGGINIYNNKTENFRTIVSDDQNKDAINNDLIQCVYEDNYGNVWIGTQGGGVNTYFKKSSRFQLYKGNKNEKNTLVSSSVYALLQDREGIVWIGTAGGGLSTFDRSTNVYTQYPQLSTASNNSILSLCEDSEGKIWVGTWGDGVKVYDKQTKKIKTFTEFNKIDAGTILSIYQDSFGLIWIGTLRGGLYVYNKFNNSFEKYNTTNGLNNDIVYKVLEDKNHNIWIATDGGGLNKLDAKTKKFSYYIQSESDNSISSNTVNDIYEDSKGNIWIATSNGLNKLDVRNNKIVCYYEKDGLPNTFVYCVIEDKKGHLWLTTNKGVSEFNPLILNENGIAFKNYDVGSGLQGMEFNQGAFFKSNNGALFFGGDNGFNIYDTNTPPEFNESIPVYITSYQRFGKEIQLDTLIYDKKYLELSYTDNFFAFDFAALDLQMPVKNKFSFKLEGVDADWSPPSTQHYTSYTDLRGGNYIFRVKATNNDGEWSQKVTNLFIRINPPFWKTKWFYFLMALMVISAFWAFLKYRTNHIKRENKLLEEKVQQRTIELAGKNRDITSSIEYAKRIQLAILPPLQQLYSYLPNSFVLYKPKDIVSGDFYWFGVKGDEEIIAAVDCTGHGVPGAFMSMIGHNLLNQIINENGVTEPDKILTALNKGVQSALKQGANEVETTDGMDIALCKLNRKNNTLIFAGANRPLFIVNNGIAKKIDANKFAIGGSQLSTEKIFTSQLIHLQKGDCVYLFTDGYADQFGGEKGKKFMVKNFVQLLISIQNKSMQEQGVLLESRCLEWKGNLEQVDDILVIGFTL